MEESKMTQEQEKNTVTTDLLNEYMEERYQGKHPDIQDYLQKCPECAEELEKLIDDFEWVLKVTHYDEVIESAEDICTFVEKIQPELIEKVKKVRDSQRIWMRKNITKIFK